VDWLSAIIEKFLNKHFKPPPIPQYLSGKGKAPVKNKS
jgi:hypothetical protein